MAILTTGPATVAGSVFGVFLGLLILRSIAWRVWAFLESDDEDGA